ncbi:MAG: PilN domain-containing protein [Proteobacteria bacterium]|nr:PilN domain-containing protein [Pseudomonadota bacterium]
MIKINLLPYREIEKKEKILFQFVIMISAMVISLVIVGIVHWRVVAYEKDKITERDELKNEIAELDKKLGQIDKIKGQKSEIERKLGVIDTLNTKRIVSTELVYKIGEAVPESVWLTNLQDKDKEVAIDGEAYSANDVSNFMERLGRVGLFTKVNLISLDQQVKGNVKIIKFNLICLKG